MDLLSVYHEHSLRLGPARVLEGVSFLRTEIHMSTCEDVSIYGSHSKRSLLSHMTLEVKSPPFHSGVEFSEVLGIQPRVGCHE